MLSMELALSPDSSLLDPGCPTRAIPGPGRGWGAAGASLPREGSLQGLFPFSFLNIHPQDPTKCKTLL